MQSAMRSKQFISLIFVPLLGCMLLQGACKEKKEPQSESTTLTNNETRSISTVPDTATLKDQMHIASSAWDKNQDSIKTVLLQIARRCLMQQYYKGAVDIFTFLGNALSSNAQYDSSLYYLKQALFYSYKLPTNYEVTEVYVYMAGSYYHLSKLDTAALYIYKALANVELGQTKNYRASYLAYKFIAAFWLNNENIENAQPYLDKAEKIALRGKDKGNLADALCSKAAVYSRRGMEDSAIFYYEAALKRKHIYPLTRLDANASLGKIYVRSRQAEKAIPYLLEGLRLARASKRQKNITQINSYLGAAYVQLGDHTKAAEILKNVIDSASISGIDKDIVKAYRNLAAAYHNSKDFEQSSEQLFKTLELQDSLHNKENMEMLGRLEMKYRIAEKDRALAQKQLQITQQQSDIKERNFFIAVIIGGVAFLSALFFGIWRSRKKKEEIVRLHSMFRGEEKERTRIAHELHDGIISELAAVKMQFNAFEYQIREREQTDDLKEAMAQLEEITEELRKTSHNLMPEILIQSGIEIAVRSFCEKLMKNRVSRIAFQSYGEIPRLDLEFELTIYRIIQELVQNAFKHANASHVLVQLSGEGQLLTVTVEDNGKGIEDKQDTDGMGLNNIRTRVKALDGHITIESSEESGTSAYLEFNTFNHRLL